MDSDFIAQAERQLIKINESLKAYEGLIRERAALETFLAECRKPSSAAEANSPPSSPRSAFVPVAGQGIKKKPGHKFKRNPDSKEMRFARAFQRYLSSTSERQTRFLDGYTAVTNAEPRLARVSKEYARSALQRVGGRVGIVYESAEAVRLSSGDKREDPGVLASGS